MNTKEYVQSLFKDYEESSNLKDFMEELQSNLDARVASLMKKGHAENDAFDKASAELGDISVLADELSLKKRREVFEEVYMDLRNYMSTKRVASYVIFGAAALFGIIIAFVCYYGSAWRAFYGDPFFDSRWSPDYETGAVVFIGALMPFLVTSIAGFTFLGLTQETKSHFPMSRKRAAWYTVAAAFIGFGLFIIPITYFSFMYRERPFVIMTTIAVLIPFILPGSVLLCFLGLTEKKRLKPWALSSRMEAAKHMGLLDDPVVAQKFGLFSGAIWIFATALFFLFGFLFGFRLSWVVFVFAVATQLLIQGFLVKKS